MKRNAIVPYLLIMVFGIGLIFALSLIDNGGEQAGEGTEEQGGGDTTAQSPEELYNSTCFTCHGQNYEGGAGPELAGVGERLSADEIKEVLINGRGAMPGGLASGIEDEMTEWLISLGEQ